MVVKQIFTVCFSFLLLLFIFIPSVQAENGQMYEVGTAILEVKNAPAQNAEVIGRLVRGDKVTIFQEKFGWVQTYYDGKEAWVASQYLIPINIEAKKDIISKKDPDEKTKKPFIGDDSQKKVEKPNIHPIILDATNNHAKPLDEWKIIESPKVKSASTTISTKSLSSYHIVIDPGHGGKDSGATEDGVYEKKLTLSTAKLVAEKLQNRGAAVTLTRSDDSYVSLDKRVHISNSRKTNVFISLHYNAFNDPTVGGINTFYFAGEQDIKLAKSIQDSLINSVNLNNRGAKQADYYVLRNNHGIAILVELGFITNPRELEKVQTTQYQEKVSEGIANGLMDYIHN